MNPSIQQQASQAAQQGQQLISEDKAKSAAAEGNYNTYSQQATSANQDLQKESSYMQGEGSGENVYNRELGNLESQGGYNPAQLSDANKSLFQLTGALNSANNSFSTPGGVGAYGISAPALASYEGSILTPLTTGVSNANTEVGALNSELNTFQTGAAQATSSQVQSEQNVVTALGQAVQNYQAQASAALQSMQFYSQLASTQGNLNASEQQAYGQAQQAYAAAQQAIAQAKLIASQTVGQDITNRGSVNQLPNGTVVDGLTSAGTTASPASAAQPAATTPIRKNSSSGSSSGGPNYVSEFFNNPKALGQQLGNGIGNVASSAGRDVANWGGGLVDNLTRNFNFLTAPTGSVKVSR